MFVENYMRQWTVLCFAARCQSFYNEKTAVKYKKAVKISRTMSRNFKGSEGWQAASYEHAL